MQNVQIIQPYFYSIPDDTLFLVNLLDVREFTHNEELFVHQDYMKDKGGCAFHGTAEEIKHYQVVLKKKKDHWAALTVIGSWDYTPLFSDSFHEFVPIKLCQATRLRHLSVKTPLPFDLDTILYVFPRDVMNLVGQYILSYRVPVKDIILFRNQAWLKEDTFLGIGDLIPQWATVSNAKKKFTLCVLAPTVLREYVAKPKYSISCNLIVKS